MSRCQCRQCVSQHDRACVCTIVWVWEEWGWPYEARFLCFAVAVWPLDEWWILITSNRIRTQDNGNRHCASGFDHDNVLRRIYRFQHPHTIWFGERLLFFVFFFNFFMSFLNRKHFSRETTTTMTTNGENETEEKNQIQTWWHSLYEHKI